MPLLDKSWPPGPWDNEPDEHVWKAHGFACCMVRHSILGHWCGYVFLPKGHSLHGEDDKAYRELCVHGGVSFVGADWNLRSPISPQGAWVIGFDCNHSWDIAPGMQKMLGDLSALDDYQVYRTFDYVKSETENLAKQLAEMEEEADG